MDKREKDIEPVYFMDLVVENVRCFKDKQEMDLSNGNGKPAQWTIILGDNGTGKATLLKCLASLQPIAVDKIYQEKEGDFPTKPQGLPIDQELFDPNFHFDNDWIGCSKLSRGKLSDTKNYFLKGFGFNSFAFSITTEILSEKSMFIIAFGASRRMGVGSLTETTNNNSILSLFNSANLINAEAWLLETDFAIRNAKNSTKKYLQNYYSKVKTILKLIFKIR